MSSAVLLNELRQICSELNSEKIPTRNKALDKLDNLLANSKTDLITIYKQSQKESIDPTWGQVFSRAVDAAVNHSVKVHEAKGTKGFQTLRNRNNVYNSIISKLIDYSLEDNNNLLSKTTALEAFRDGFSNRLVVMNFGRLFLQILERGIYKSDGNAELLTVNELSSIFSYLFEVNIPNDQGLKLALLRCINKTMELCINRVQLNFDFKDYFYEVKSLATDVQDELTQSEVIKMYYMFIQELSEDYHLFCCEHIQETLPTLCGFYNVRMKQESKIFFFKSVKCSLQTIYPNLPKGDSHPVGFALGDDWPKTLQKLLSVIEVDIKEQTFQQQQFYNNRFEAFTEVFVKAAAMVIYLVNCNQNQHRQEDSMESRKKISRSSDLLEDLLPRTRKENSINQIWMEVITELITTQPHLINPSNFVTILQACQKLVSVLKSVQILKSTRYQLLALLKVEAELFSSEDTNAQCWQQIVDALITDNTNDPDILKEKHLLLQDLIRWNKFSQNDCISLMNSLTANNTMRLNECIATLRELIWCQGNHNIDKSSEVITKLLNWLCQANTKLDAKSLLLNISPVDGELIADTSVLMVVNFLESSSARKECHMVDVTLLDYKYCAKYICLENHGKELRNESEKQLEKPSSKCIIQSNYELLMRLLNFESSKETTMSAIIMNLNPLLKKVLVLRRFFEHGIFDENSCATCPLVKRIGFFLDSIDFQVKSINVHQTPKSEIIQCIEMLLNVFENICPCPPFLNLLTKQTIDGLLAFIGSILSQNSTSTVNADELNLKCLILLATLCASSTHRYRAFGFIKKQRLSGKQSVSLILTITKIFCSQEQNQEIAAWFTDHLKTICQLYHKNIEISERIVDIIPDIVRYVEPYEHELQLVFIVISSFMKLAFKKSYPPQFTSKLIRSIRQVARHCPNLVILDDFISICTSLAKFLSSPSLTVLFAVVDTITGLMDSKWVVVHPSNYQSYFNFCNTLYSNLEWNSLSMDSADTKRNSLSVTIQLLVSLLAFSSFHRAAAVEDLSAYCATQNLTESNFSELSRIADYYKCSLTVFAKPYVDALLHEWAKKQRPIMRFPYFLCASNREKFFSVYISNICFYQFCCRPAQALDEMQEFGSKQELISRAFPICYAFLLSSLTESIECTSEYQTEAEQLRSNLNKLGVDPNDCGGKISSTTIYYATKQLWNQQHFAKLFGFNIPVNNPKFCLSLDGLKRILELYLRKCFRLVHTSKNSFLMLLKTEPMTLLKVLTAFKIQFSDFVFIDDRLRAFYWFCGLVEVMIDSISIQPPSVDLDSNQTFFLRDVLFFIINIIRKENVEPDIVGAGLKFIHYVFSKYILCFLNIIRTHLNDIISVIVMIERANPNFQECAIALLELIICQGSSEFTESIKVLDKFPSSNTYKKLQDAQQKLTSEPNPSLKSVVQNFLRVQSNGAIGISLMKQYISEKKSEIGDLSVSRGIHNSSLLYDLVKKLIYIVRGNDSTLSMEAAKCLGEIGSIKIGDISFYFESETTSCNSESAYQVEEEFFAESFYKLLDKEILRYDPRSCVEMYEVCKDLVNSRIGSKVVASYPMLTVFVLSGRTSPLDKCNVSSTNFAEILERSEHLAYDNWVHVFASNIYKHCQWSSFARLCELNLTFAESAIIPIFKLLLAEKDANFQNIISMLEIFFKKTFENINQKDESLGRRTIYGDKRIIKYFLHICECIRINNNWDIPIDQLQIAAACVYCQAYFMGILYLEMWALKEKENPNSASSEIIKNPVFQEIATKAYKSIDCADALSGILDPLNSRLEYLSLQDEWLQVLLEVEASNGSNEDFYRQHLKRNGLMKLSNCYESKTKVDFECCWRLCEWDIVVDSNEGADFEYEFEKNHYNALKSIYNREEINCISAIDKARQAIVSILKEISIECLQNIYKYLTRLQMLQQAEDFCQVQFGSSSLIETIFPKWNLEQKLMYGNFDCTELILSQQISLHKTAGIRTARKIKEFFKEKNAVGECILQCINECKNSGNTNLALKNICILRNMETSDQLKAKALVEEADIYWKNGNSRMAKEILHHVMSNKNFIYCLERIQGHRMYGELLLDTNNETFDVVHNEFFLRSIELLDKYREHKDKILKSIGMGNEEFERFDAESRKAAYATIAKYADKEYLQLNAYMNSDTFRTKVQITKSNRAEAKSLANQSKDRDKTIGISVMLRNCVIDDKEIKSLELKRSENLCTAVENYIQFSILDDAVTSPSIYRIIALWFANKHDEILHEKIEQTIKEIPSYKFLCVLNQMTARLSSKVPQFLDLLESILVKCIEDHPHQTLYKVLAIVFECADNPKKTTVPDRVNIAKNIINKAKTKSTNDCIKQMEAMFSALIDFANKDAGKSAFLTLPEKLQKLKNLEHVQCPTVDLPVAVNKDYHPIYIHKWETKVDLVGGINAPKKLQCICSDGVSRPQLLKGKDDLRQDAVMQQVLSMVNGLLASDPETSEQKLLLRTYRVVPLSMRSGILEWCQNTVPLGFYLTGDKKTKGAHKKYRPNDYSLSHCRSVMLEVLKKRDFKQQFSTYTDICDHIKPVLHYFFLEKFLVSGIWFERRLAYTKSVATTSIVGFILGLGDRHLQNILIDESTGEVIHIDFGIAFEQGKVMPTPETVPFRLTRDIVAPMGISKADGIFRQACEKTMKILRKNHVFLTTILEVLLYDPLYIWKWSSPKTLEGNGNEDDEERNLTAQRALLRVQSKLEGREEGNTGTFSVEVHVQRLINEAMNPHSLCQLYPGWDPYL